MSDCFGGAECWKCCGIVVPDHCYLSLSRLCSESRNELVLCAPFVKKHLLEHLLSTVPRTAAVDVFTRWRPEEIAAGVSDVEVLDVVQARGGRVLLHDSLHAKFYRNDADLLLGSANLTAAALGMGPAPNIELLVPAEKRAVAAVEQRLRDESVVATAEMAADALATALELGPLPPELAPADAVSPLQGPWVPQFRYPRDLYLMYSRGVEGPPGNDSLAEALAHYDLLALSIPPGLSREPFYLLVRHRLQQQMVVVQVNKHLYRPRRFGEMRRMVGDFLDLSRDDATVAWQTLMRWLLEFCPDIYDYESHGHSEVMSRRGSR